MCILKPIHDVWNILLYQKNIYNHRGTTHKNNLVSSTGKSQAAGLLMLGEVTLESKLLPTSLAIEGLHIAVSLYMGSQVALVGETFVTLCASVGFLPGVGPDVSLQQPGPGE